MFWCYRVQYCGKQSGMGSWCWLDDSSSPEHRQEIQDRRCKSLACCSPSRLERLGQQTRDRPAGQWTLERRCKTEVSLAGSIHKFFDDLTCLLPTLQIFKGHGVHSSQIVSTLSPSFNLRFFKWRKKQIVNFFSPRKSSKARANPFACAESSRGLLRDNKQSVRFR